MKRTLVTAAISVVVCTSVLMIDGQKSVEGHCQVPCGIYDDPGRIQAMLEDTTTIAKAVGEINALSSKDSPQDINQAVRWINTKEEHASHIIETVSLYFLTQKVKPVASGDDGYKEYLLKLADHHAVLRAAMKTKQTVDPGAVSQLQAAIEKLGAYYPGS